MEQIQEQEEQNCGNCRWNKNCKSYKIRLEAKGIGEDVEFFCSDYEELE
ncbi:MAG: hypothetical protein M0R17_05805 [Candidatus Omnitrophica bacterium]|jgi:hypothetical protein|nr:hypothetical protein [Candidatus Omnitrophota bacterium]